MWTDYRYIALYDAKSETGITVIDLGAGHAHAGETLMGRAITTLKSRALLNESPGAGYLERRWPEPFKKSGALSAFGALALAAIGVKSRSNCHLFPSI